MLPSRIVRQLLRSAKPQPFSRALSTTRVCLDTENVNGSQEESPESGASPDNLRPPVNRSGQEIIPFREFLAFEGARYKYASPRNFLDANTRSQGPFPMNHSFKPLPPNSDALRAQIYEEYSGGAVLSELSQRYHMSQKRLQAIIRLKQMEFHWKKGLPLQTGFTLGMEWILQSRPPLLDPRRNAIPRDPDLIDRLEEIENRDAQPPQYVRDYWEPASADGTETTTPASLAKYKKYAVEKAKLAEALKADPYLMPRVEETPQNRRPPASQLIETPGHQSIQFVDVGAKFMDVPERLRRIAAADRRRAATGEVRGYEDDVMKVRRERKTERKREKIREMHRRRRA